MTGVFRESAVKRVSAPEKLDRSLTVTTSRSWLALATFMAMTALVVAWSIFGEVSTYVPAQGILLNQGGKIVDAPSTSVGTLTRILHGVGDTVEKDDPVAESVNTVRREEYRSAMALVAEREQALQALRQSLQAEAKLFSRSTRSQRRRLARLEHNGRRALKAARKRWEDYRRLFEKKLETKTVVDRSRLDYDRAQRELFTILRERDKLEAGELQRIHKGKTRLIEMESRLLSAKRQANELASQLATQRILAPVAGRITEIKVPIGALLEPGQSVVSIRTGVERLGALMYIPPADGKRVQEGMAVLLSPASLRREKFGSLKGLVESVSEFPISRDGMIAVLQNSELASTFSGEGSPYVSRVTLVPDPSTASGYAWTSPKASSVTVTSGTLATAEIKVDSQPPIALVVPLLRKLFGGR